MYEIDKSFDITAFDSGIYTNDPEVIYLKSIVNRFLSFGRSDIYTQELENKLISACEVRAEKDDRYARLPELGRLAIAGKKVDGKVLQRCGISFGKGATVESSIDAYINLFKEEDKVFNQHDFGDLSRKELDI